MDFHRSGVAVKSDDLSGETLTEPLVSRKPHATHAKDRDALTLGADGQVIGMAAFCFEAFQEIANRIVEFLGTPSKRRYKKDT